MKSGAESRTGWPDGRKDTGLASLYDNGRTSSGRSPSLFNGYIASHVFLALSEVGFLDLLRKRGSVDSVEASRELGLDHGLLQDCCRVMAAVGVFDSVEAGGFRWSPATSELQDQIGYFIWAIKGNGQLLTSLTEILSQESDRDGNDIALDNRSIARGAAAVGRRFLIPRIMGALGSTAPASIWELGCGTGELLVELCAKHETSWGTGIDVSQDACVLASESVRQAGLTDRVEIRCEDVREWTDGLPVGGPEPATPAGPDLVTASLVLHDLLAAWDDPAGVLRSWRASAPSNATFLFVDTMKSSSVRQLAIQDVFAVGFEIVHAARGQTIFEKEHYDAVFADAGFRIEHHERLGVPNTWLYLLRGEHP